MSSDQGGPGHVHRTGPRRFQTVQYDKIAQLFCDPLTKSLRDRQASNLRRIVSQNPNGIHLGDLSQIIRICDLTLDAMLEDVNAIDILLPPICDLIQLLSNGFCTERTCEYDQYHESIIAYLKWIWKASSIQIGQSRQLNITSCDALRRYFNTDKVWQYSMPDRCLQTLPDELQRWRPMQDVAESDIINDMVKSIIDTDCNENIFPSRAMLLRDLSMSPITGAQLLSEQCHLLAALAVLLHTNRRDVIVGLAVETIWNLFEQCHTLASIRLGHDFIVKSFTTILSAIFQPGSSLQSRGLRNQILGTLTFISRIPEIGPVFVRTGLIEFLLAHSIDLELGRINSTSFQLEDVEMKKLIWTLISDLTSEPRCISIYASGSLIPALLVHADIGSGPASLHVLIQVDRHSLALSAFQLLNVLVPKLSRVFHRENGLKRMSQFLRVGNDRVAELDRVAISVLLKACKSHNDCLNIIEDICVIFTDSSRLSQVRSDLAVLLAHCTSLAPTGDVLRNTGALDAAINSIADVKSSVKLIASSLYIVKQACSGHEHNLKYFLEQDGVQLVMQLLTSSPSKELQRAAMTFIDDLTVQFHTIMLQLIDYKPALNANLITSLLNVWRSECNMMKGRCIHGPISSTRSCHGQCHISADYEKEPVVSNQQISMLSTLSRIIQRITEINAITSPDDIFQISMIAMYDDIRICNAWSECVINHGLDGTGPQFLNTDLEPMRNRMECLSRSIECRIEQARSDAEQARQEQEAKFGEFAQTIRMFIDQRRNPPEHKILTGASTLVASSRLKLSKEQKKEMCSTALQLDKTMEHILQNNIQGLSIIEKTRDYIDDVVLGDPVLYQVWSAMEKIRPGSGSQHIS